MLSLRSLPRIACLVVLIPFNLPAQPRSDYHRVAVATRRIDRGRLDIRIFQGKHPVPLGHFRELAVVTPVNHTRRLDYLAQESVLLVRSDKVEGEWNVYTEATPKDAAIVEAAYFPASQRDEGLPLSDNFYRVERVIVSTREAPVAVKMDGEFFRLKAGEALLVLG